MIVVMVVLLIVFIDHFPDCPIDNIIDCFIYI